MRALKAVYMKRLAIFILVVCSLCGCGKDQIINRTNIYGVFNLEYKYFNSEDTCQFELKQDEKLHFVVETTNGSIEVKVVDIDNQELFYEDILVSKSFDIAPEKEGRYIVVLTGHKAEGMIDITTADATGK